MNENKIKQRKEIHKNINDILKQKENKLLCVVDKIDVNVDFCLTKRKLFFYKKNEIGNKLFDRRKMKNQNQ